MQTRDSKTENNPLLTEEAKKTRFDGLKLIRESLSRTDLELSSTEIRNATIVLNTLDWIAQDPEKVNARKGQARDTFLPDFPGANNNACLIHLSSTGPNSPYSNNIPEGNEGVSLILGSWVDIFITAFQKAHALGPKEIKEFFSRLDGVCIDSRISGAINYGMGLDAPQSFSGYLHCAIRDMPPFLTGSYFECFNAIQTYCWEEHYHADTKSKYKTQYAENKGTFDESAFPLIARYLSDLGLKPNNGFLQPEGQPFNTAILLKFVLFHPHLLDEIGLPEIAAPQPTADAKDEKTDSSSIAAQTAKLQTSFKLAQQKALQISMTADNELLHKSYRKLLFNINHDELVLFLKTEHDFPLLLTLLKRTDVVTCYQIYIMRTTDDPTLFIEKITSLQKLNPLLQIYIDKLTCCKTNNPATFKKIINDPDNHFLHLAA
jgi:hypothetical protein